MAGLDYRYLGKCKDGRVDGKVRMMTVREIKELIKVLDKFNGYCLGSTYLGNANLREALMSWHSSHQKISREKVEDICRIATHIDIAIKDAIRIALSEVLGIEKELKDAKD